MMTFAGIFTIVTFWADELFNLDILIVFNIIHIVSLSTFVWALIEVINSKIKIPGVVWVIIALGCVPIAEYGTPSTEEIPDAVSKYLQSFDAVLLENHGALAFSDSLLNAYHKMESVEFYAKLLYLSGQLGGAKELSKGQVERLFEIRRAFGLPGKHPANLCPNAKAGLPSCHSCKGTCGATLNADGGANEDLVAQITKKVMEQLGK